MLYKQHPHPRFYIDAANRDYPWVIEGRLRTLIDMLEALHRQEIDEAIEKHPSLQALALEVEELASHPASRARRHSK